MGWYCQTLQCFQCHYDSVNERTQEMSESVKLHVWRNAHEIYEATGSLRRYVLANIFSEVSETVLVMWLRGLET